MLAAELSQEIDRASAVFAEVKIWSLDHSRCPQLFADDLLEKFVSCQVQ